MVVGACEAPEVGDVLDRIREMTGIYGLGFRRESILGLVVPIAFVILVAVIFFRDAIVELIRLILDRL
jgi:hypothetical protein